MFNFLCLFSPERKVYLSPYTIPFAVVFGVVFGLLSIFRPAPIAAQQWEVIEPEFHPAYPDEDISLNMGTFFTSTSGIALSRYYPHEEGQDLWCFRLWKTEDGGYNWHLVSENDSPSMSINDMTFPDSLHGWIVGNSHPGYPENSPVILRTEDGGRHWEPLSFPAEYFPNLPFAIDTLLYEVTFLDSLTGFVGSIGSIFRTTDGGTTWDSTHVPRGYDQTGELFFPAVNDIAFVDSLHGWATGGTGLDGAGTILHSTDGGVHWAVSDSFTLASNAIAFASENFGAAFGGFWGAAVQVTSDGGNQWDSPWVQVPVPLFDGGWVDTTEGWAVGADGAIVHTTDAGSTWNVLPQLTMAHLLDIDFPSGVQVGYIFTGDSTMLKYDTTATRTAPLPEPLPRRIRLASPYPNPFNARTTIQYHLPRAMPVTVDVVDLAGHRVTLLTQSHQNAGAYRVFWNGKNSRGEMVSSGVYFIRLRTPGGVHSRKILYIK